jgi:hypothetical protein
MDAEPNNQWRFAQCFGDKGEVEDITEGMSGVRLFNQAGRHHFACPLFGIFTLTLNDFDYYPSFLCCAHLST